jgi:hypothetical protein
MVAPKTKIRKSIQVDLVIQLSLENIALAPTGKSVVLLRASRAHKRGVSRSSRALVRDAMDAGGAARRAVSSRTAKLWRPDASTLASSWRQCLRIALTMVARKPDHQGDHKGNR